MTETVQTSRPESGPRSTRAAAPFGEAELAQLYEKLGVGPHPILPLPTLEQARAFRVNEPGPGREEFVRGLQLRQTRIARAAQDPMNWTFESETWADADRVLLHELDTRPVPPEPVYLLGIFGGNRAQKTWYAVKRLCECAVLFPGALLACCDESEQSSIDKVQLLAWFYLKRHFAWLNKKQRTENTGMNYSRLGGFSDRKIGLPTGTVIHFPTYNQSADDYEGWEFGAPVDTYAWVSRRLREALAVDDPAEWRRLLPHLYRGTGADAQPIVDLAAWRAMGRTEIPNVGAVCDESMPLSWLKMFSRRAKFRRAKVLWTFTPVRGITPAIKELVGATGLTLERRPSELLPGQNFPELPKGHMPYRRACAMTGAQAIYFFTLYNRFGPGGGRTYYDEIKTLCSGKTNEYIERVAYGFARDGISRAFKNYGPHNKVRRDQVPEIGTLYFFFDPHGIRNFPMIWVWVVPTRPVSLYLVREWPDLPTFGEWAVPSERAVSVEHRKGWDGDPGPAQAGLGWGVVHYKREILRQELIPLPPELTQAAGPLPAERVEALVRALPGWQRARVRQALRTGETLPGLRETVTARFGDPRGLHNPHVSEQGGTTLFDEFEKEHVDERTGERVPPMEVWDAATTRRPDVREVDEGITKVNEMLGTEGAAAGFNQPHLFVVEDCFQVDWTLANYTGLSGGTGASKDFADLIKYGCVAGLEHVEQTARGRAGKGW